MDPVQATEADDYTRSVLEGIGRGAETNMFRTLAHHPGLLRKFFPFGAKLLDGGSLDARSRELLVLRTAALLGSEYVWAHHVVIGRDAGITDAEIDDVRLGLSSGLTPTEALLLAAAEELVSRAAIEPATLAGLAGSYGTKQLVEIPFVVGCYGMLIGFERTFGVTLEDGAAGS